MMALIYACDKEQDTRPDVPEPTCTIISPSDNEVIQLGDVVTLSVSLYGFNEDVRVAFSIDTFQIAEAIVSPFTFNWMTAGWDTGVHMIRADAYSFSAMQLESAVITVTLTDTVIPPKPPVALISISPEGGTTDSIFTFDASLSYDPDGSYESLLFRWDFDGDGSWDTDFSNENMYLHKYTHPTLYEVKLEVIDSDGMTSDTIKNLLVTHSSMPDACEGYVSLPHGGQVYHTVAIGNQCWLRENMNIGLMINSDTSQTDNNIIEKYCFNDDTANCNKYGGLYQWKEMMDYLPLQSAQGICPNGWHVPGDSEWKELEAFVDTQYEIGDPQWDLTQFRGFDAGKHLKSILGWYSGGYGDNWYDFKALAGGFWESGVGFVMETQEAHFWSSTHDSGQNGIKRMLRYDEDRISRNFHWEKAAFSVRCIRD